VTDIPSSEIEKKRREDVSLILLTELQLLSPIDEITCDESLFFLDYQYDWMLVRDKSELEEVRLRPQFPKKFIVCIFWNFYNLLYIYILDEDEHYNTSLVVNHLFPQLEQVALSHRPKNGLKSFALHWDNARPHQSIITRDEAISDSKYYCHN
jgi:hypothetical protein